MFEQGGGGGGQLGQDSDVDYWAPARVGRVQVGAAGVLPQLASDGHQLWRAVQVSCGLNHTVAVLELAEDVDL